MPSSSVPSPYVRVRFGRFSTLMAGPAGLCACTWRGFDDDERPDEADGGREAAGSGEVDRCSGGVWIAGEGGNTFEIGVRTFKREDEVGIVRRRAEGLEDGVDGRVGGTSWSSVCNRPVELA